MNNVQLAINDKQVPENQLFPSINKNDKSEIYSSLFIRHQSL